MKVMDQRGNPADEIYLCLKRYSSGESTIWLVNNESIFI